MPRWSARSPNGANTSKQQLEKAKAEWEEVRQSPDKELRRQKLFAMNQAYGACHFDEERGKYEMKAVLAFIRIWAQNKTENRMGWLQALNRVVCARRALQRLDSLSCLSAGTDREAGGAHGRQVRPRARPPALRGIRSHRLLQAGFSWLIPLNGGQKHTFLFK